MSSVLDPQLELDEAVKLARSAMHAVPAQARARLVNRTHRVVRERAKLLQERRTRDRSLMLPMILCSVLLIMSAFAVWSGLYQYQATAGEADVAGLATTDASNHLLVVTMWFVPVFVALLATIWVRRSRKSAYDEAI